MAESSPRVSEPSPQLPKAVDDTPSPATATATATATRGKRPSTSNSQPPALRRKGLKVTRACDFCKARKARCSGTLPCDSCTRRGRAEECLYDAEYRRGHKVTPVRRRAPSVSNEPASAGEHSKHENQPDQTSSSCSVSGARPPAKERPGDPQQAMMRRTSDDDGPPGPLAVDIAAPSRASPELDVAEIQGQYHDTTSGLAFLHRAFRRFSKSQGPHSRPTDLPLDGENEDSPTLAVGDKPLGLNRPNAFKLPPLHRARELILLYFDVCIATYRFLHLQSVESWAAVMIQNDTDGRPLFHGIGRAKAAIVLTLLAIATAHEDRASGRFHENEVASLDLTDAYFLGGHAFVQQETAKPTLASAQARVIQVLYLLTTSRMNQAWYVFGTAIQLISALGLHRRAGRKNQSASTADDYITSQCRIRTFWTAYILDKYIGVIFGRPVHYHDDDIDQEMPDRVNDEEMLPTGPTRPVGRRRDCHLDALVHHAMLARMLSKAARTVYSIKQIPNSDRIDAANSLSDELNHWQASLPPHLGSVQPSSLIPQFRRQTITLQIAYAHAVLHVNRPFLLGKMTTGSEDRVRASIMAARSVLETVEDMVTEGGKIFHAFWWTHYVTFCALAVIYAWEVQSRRVDFCFSDISHAETLDLADKCQRHLAQATANNSPSRRYALILEKLRKEALRRNNGTSQKSGSHPPQQLAHHQQSQQQQQLAWKSMSTNNMTGTGQPTPASEVPEDISQSNNNHMGHNGQLMGFPNEQQFYGNVAAETSPQGSNYSGPQLDGMNWSIQEWQSEDWLNLDSMAFGTFLDSHDTPLLWTGPPGPEGF